jgi:glycosyltransferase involved in cell wall biosynthesis
LAGIPRPRIGYCGTISAKIDFELLLKVAMARPNWHWVLLGEESYLQSAPDAGWMKAWNAFRALPNAHYLGSRSFDEIAAYASHMDVNTICYRTEGAGWWSFGSPNKLHESLASGKPLVATPLETVRPFEHVVRLAVTAEDWIEAIRHALEGGGTGTPAERRAVAWQNTWERRVDVLEDWLFEMTGAATSSPARVPHQLSRPA